MARLPTVGGDSGNWGTVLNEYLQTAHNANGTLKLDVQTIADLKAIDVATLTDKQQALVAGYSAPGDGGGGQFYYDLAASDADDGGTVLTPGAGSGRWKRTYSGRAVAAWFGVTATNNALPAAKALAWLFAASGRELTFTASANLDGMAVVSVNSASGTFTISGENGATLTRTDSGFFLTISAVAGLTVRGLTLTGFRRPLYYNNFTTSGSALLIDRCRIEGATTYAAIMDGGSTTGGFVGLTIRDTVFDSNYIDIQITLASIALATVHGNRFMNGGPESCLLSPTVGTKYIFTSNHFYNYNNTRTGSDADGHFIRCEGQYAVISNNIFDTLNCESNDGLDTEALRPQCNDVIVSHNIFIDAGMNEGVCAIKGGERYIVQGNKFSVTDAYKARHAALGVGSRALQVQGARSHIYDNEFIGFDSFLLEYTGSIADGHHEFSRNTIIDCGNSSRLINVTSGANCTFLFEGNTIAVSNEASPVNTPACIFAKFTGEGCRYILKGNRWHTSDIVFNGPDTGRTMAELVIDGDVSGGTPNHLVYNSGGAITAIDIRPGPLRILNGTDWFDVDAGSFIGGPSRYIIPIQVTHSAGVTRLFQLPIANGKIANLRYYVAGRGADGGVSRYVYEGTYLGGNGSIAIQDGALDVNRVTTAANWSAADITTSANQLLVRIGGRNTFETVWSGVFEISVA